VAGGAARSVTRTTAVGSILHLISGSNNIHSNKAPKAA
jgi:hypothetical protein